MGQQEDDAVTPGNPGAPQGWNPEQAPPTVIGPALGAPGPGAGPPAGQPLQGSPWPAYQPAPPPGPQLDGPPGWGQPPGGQPQQWGPPQQGGQAPGGLSPQWGQPSPPGGYGGPPYGGPAYGGPPRRPGLGMLFQGSRRRRRRHPFLRAVLVIVLVFIVAGVVAAINRSSDSDDSGAASGSAPTATYTAAVGSGITLAGLEAGEQLNITVSRVFNRAPAADSFEQAPAGMRLYAVQFVLKNTGSAAYSDAPGNSATVIDSAGKSFKTQFDVVSSCSSLPAVTTIAAGASTSGCVVYEVPAASKITKVRFILDSGYGPQTGFWKIR